MVFRAWSSSSAVVVRRLVEPFDSCLPVLLARKVFFRKVSEDHGDYVYVRILDFCPPQLLKALACIGVQLQVPYALEVIMAIFLNLAPIRRDNSEHYLGAKQWSRSRVAQRLYLKHF